MANVGSLSVAFTVMLNLEATVNFMPRITRLCLPLTAGMLMLLPSVLAAADTAQPTPILVELFTSEGCSDCPPADALLRKMDEQPVPGAELIVLEEHVDYWDDQGWKDPFSSHEWTIRQSEYAGRLHVKEPYTPQMIVEGAEQFVGNDGRKAQTAIDSAVAHPNTVATQVSGMKVDHGKVQAYIQTGPVSANAEIFVAIALDHAETQVNAGENSGHKLEHVAILENLSRVGKVHAGESFSKDISVSDHLSGKPGRLIVFVQEPNQGKVLGAVMQPLQSE